MWQSSLPLKLAQPPPGRFVCRAAGRLTPQSPRCARPRAGRTPSRSARRSRSSACGCSRRASAGARGAGHAGLGAKCRAGCWAALPPAPLNSPPCACARSQQYRFTASLRCCKSRPFPGPTSLKACTTAPSLPSLQPCLDVSLALRAALAVARQPLPVGVRGRPPQGGQLLAPPPHLQGEDGRQVVGVWANARTRCALGCAAACWWEGRARAARAARAEQAAACRRNRKDQRSMHSMGGGKGGGRHLRAGGRLVRVLAAPPAKRAATGGALSIEPCLLLLGCRGCCRRGQSWGRCRALRSSSHARASRTVGRQRCQRCCQRPWQAQRGPAARAWAAAHAAGVRCHVPLRPQLLEALQAGGWHQARRGIHGQRHRAAWLRASGAAGVTCRHGFGTT